MIKNIKTILALFFACFFLISPIFSAKKKNNRNSKNIIQKSKKEKGLELKSELELLNNAIKENKVEAEKTRIKNLKELLDCGKNTSHDEFKNRITFLLKYINAQDNFVEAAQSFARISADTSEYSKSPNSAIDIINDLFSKEAPHKLRVICLKHGTLISNGNYHEWKINRSLKELTQKEVDDIASEAGQKFSGLITILKRNYKILMMEEQFDNKNKLFMSSLTQAGDLYNSTEAKNYSKVIKKCLYIPTLLAAILDHNKRIKEAKSQLSNSYNYNELRYYLIDNNIRLKYDVDKIYKHYQSNKPEFDQLKDSAHRIFKTQLKQKEFEISSSSRSTLNIPDNNKDSLDLETSSVQNNLSRPDNSIDKNVDNSVMKRYHKRVLDWFTNTQQALGKQGYKNQLNPKKYAKPHTHSRIVKHHKFSVIVDNYIKALGIKAEWKDNKGRTISYNIPGEIIYDDNKREVGVFSYGINDDKTCYHRSFSKRAYPDVAGLVSERIFDVQFPSLESSTDSSKTIEKTKKEVLKLLQNDQSRVIKEDNYAITIADPENQMTILLYKVTH